MLATEWPGHTEGYPGPVGSPFAEESDTKVLLDGF